MTGKLCDRDHELMDTLLEQMFDDVRSQCLGKADFVETIAFVITAIDRGEHAEAWRCFEKRAEEARTPLRILGRGDAEAVAASDDCSGAAARWGTD